MHSLMRERTCRVGMRKKWKKNMEGCSLMLVLDSLEE